MKLKTFSKLYMWTKLIKKCLLEAISINSFICFILLLPVVSIITIEIVIKMLNTNLINLFGFNLYEWADFLLFIRMEMYTIVILCTVGLIFTIFEIFTIFLYKKLSLNISDDYKSIIFYLVNRKHKFIKLNLEIEKLSKAFNNHSNVYNELNSKDFPYLNKFLRRTVFLVGNNPNSSSFAEFATPTPIGTSTATALMDTRNIEKLNLSENPKLLTLDSVDNELNDLINSRLKILHQDKCRVENDKHSCSSYLANQLEVKLEDIG